jgi:drug/metabolite transporter (DMT)-like permease
MRNQAIIPTKIQNKTIIMIAAFAAVYLIWGSTYLAMKYAIETLPSFLMAGTRFLLAGAVLFVWARLSSDYERPKLVHWRTSLIVGGLLLLGGNGGVVIAQHYLPSSLTALLIATEPFWVVLIGWLFMGNARPNFKVILGLLVGFAGVSLLISGRGLNFGDGGGQLLGIVLIVFSTIAWASGSLYGLRAASPKSALLGAGMQMLSGGLLLILLGLITGEWQSFKFADVSTNSWIALGYLTVFGSLIGFTAYSWLLKNVEPSLASTYAYVNPVIAVILGWAIAGESLTGQMLVGAAVIIGSVVLITSHQKEKEPPESEEEEEEIHESNTPAGDCKPLSASA